MTWESVRRLRTIQDEHSARGIHVSDQKLPGRPETDRDIGVEAHMYSMDPRLRDLAAAAAAFLVFLVLVIALPAAMTPGIGYLIALVGFILAMSAAGYYTIEKLT
jgi:hypothetical protein